MKKPTKRQAQDSTLIIRALKKRLALLEERLGFVEEKASATATKVFQLEADVPALTLQFNNLEESLAAQRTRGTTPIDQDGKNGWE